MAITKVWIEDSCITCGLSEELCSAVFKVPFEADQAVVRKGVDYSEYEEEIKNAAEQCPVEAIKYK